MRGGSTINGFDRVGIESKSFPLYFGRIVTSSQFPNRRVWFDPGASPSTDLLRTKFDSGLFTLPRCTSSPPPTFGSPTLTTHTLTLLPSTYYTKYTNFLVDPTSHLGSSGEYPYTHIERSVPVTTGPTLVSSTLFGSLRSFGESLLTSFSLRCSYRGQRRNSTLPEPLLPLHSRCRDITVADK